MVEVIQSGKSDAQRIAVRLKPSAGSPDTASTQVTTGTGPTRCITTVHHGSSQKQHGEVRQGAGTIIGGPNTPMPNRGE
jgi:hypothetical protein